MKPNNTLTDMYAHEDKIDAAYQRITFIQHQIRVFKGTPTEQEFKKKLIAAQSEYDKIIKQFIK